MLSSLLLYIIISLTIITIIFFKENHDNSDDFINNNNNDIGNYCNSGRITELDMEREAEAQTDNHDPEVSLPVGGPVGTTIKETGLNLTLTTCRRRSVLHCCWKSCGTSHFWLLFMKFYACMAVAVVGCFEKRCRPNHPQLGYKSP